MHLPSFLLLATTASTLVSARVDRLPSAHRQFARAAAAEPEPYRLFGAKSSASSGSSSPFVKRDDGPTFARIGDAVNEVATALKLEMPPVVQLSTLNGSSSAKQNNAKKTQKKNQVCRKKTAEEKRKSRAAKAKAQKKEAAGTTEDQQLNVEYKPKEKQAKAHAAVSSSSSSSNNNDKSSDSSSHKSESSSSDDSSNGKIADILKPVRSLIGFSADNCGESGATDEFPNGSESWLNCGISKGNPSGKWQPPKGVTIDHITTVSIEHALATNSVWEPCKPFIPLFERIGKETNLPAILLASFALQESTCNPHVLGDNNGAFGLMQITQDKCNGMDAKGCSDPEYNVRTAAQYFNKEMSNRGGEFLEALGAYNGWYPGLSFSGATAAAYGDCCVCQQNLDYLHQMTNGWLMGKTGYEMGSYKNLAVCHD